MKRKVVWAVIIAVCLICLAVLYFVRPLEEYGSTRLSARLVACLLGFVLILLGDVLEGLAPGSRVGIKNVWTLSDKYTWQRTHRMGKFFFCLTGVIVIILSFVVPVLGSGAAGAIMIACMVVGMVGIWLYSYLVFSGKIK